MTWGEFKKTVERQGVRDSDGLSSINMDFLPDEHLPAAVPRVHFTPFEKEVMIYGLRKNHPPRQK